MIDFDVDDLLDQADGYNDRQRIEGHLDQQLAAADDAWKRSGEEFVESRARLREESASPGRDAAQTEALPPPSD